MQLALTLKPRRNERIPLGALSLSAVPSTLPSLLCSAYTAWALFMGRAGSTVYVNMGRMREQESIVYNTQALIDNLILY